MRVNYDKVRKNDTIVNIVPEDVEVHIGFCDMKQLYLTPLEALLYAVIKEYGSCNVVERKWVKIPSDMVVVFRHFDGSGKIDEALDRLVEKRLINEGDDGTLLFSDYRLFRITL